MKNTSTNQFYASATVERGDAQLRMFKALDKEECIVEVHLGSEKEVSICMSDRRGFNEATITLDVQEAKEFANMILGVADALERKGGCGATDSAL